MVGVKKDGIVHFRVEAAVTERLETLAASHPELKAAAFARMALLKGLPLIEAEYLPQPKPQTTSMPSRKAA